MSEASQQEPSIVTEFRDIVESGYQDNLHKLLSTFQELATKRDFGGEMYTGV